MNDFCLFLNESSPTLCYITAFYLNSTISSQLNCVLVEMILFRRNENERATTTPTSIEIKK